MTHLSVPIAAKNLDQAARQIKAARAAGAEMLELRTDYLENLSTDLVKSLVAAAKSTGRKQLPIIATCRDIRQGAAIDYPLRLRLDVLTAALRAGVEFIDVEYENFLLTDSRERIARAISESTKARLIISAHNFEAKFDNIGKLYRRIQAAYPAAIPKLIYSANHINDCFEAFDLLRGTGGDRIVFCMGEAGLISRIIAKKLNSFVTFASIDENAATAPGQLTCRLLKELYRYDSIGPETELYGVIGSPIAHSLSPAIHNACFDDIGVDKLYLPLLVEGGQHEFDRFMKNVLTRPRLNFKGFSVTIPHKRNALGYTIAGRGAVEPLAERIGAVNTLLIGQDGKLSAYNTDYAGAMEAITSALGPKAKLKDLPVAVIGAGGVARAIVAALRDADAQIRIYNRTIERGRKLAAEFNCDFSPLDDLPDIDAKLIINCTSIGMHPYASATPLPKKYIRKDMVVFDTVYNPPQTLLLKQAKQKKAKTIDGLSMFVNQAAAQFKLFTQKQPNTKLMRKTVCNSLSRR
ncbi:MAG: shikimate dehydrogenase [Planctomycetota bacterium]|nr:MAG: shikimate dehydrogenase [Planctomycetota bacterium]